MVRMNQVSHTKSILLSTFGGLLASAVSVAGGVLLWAWAYQFLTGQVPNHASDATIYLPASVIASLACFYILARVISKFSGNLLALYLLIPLVLSGVTLFYGHQPEYPPIHNILIILSMVIGTILAFWRSNHLTNKGTGRDKAAPVL